MNGLLEKAKKTRCLICDVDGVLTNGLIYIDNHGNELKGFHVQDGVGLKLLMAVGIDVAVITTSCNNVIDERMKQLGITHFFKGQIDKQQAFLALKQQLGLENEAFAYVGDDLPDLPVLQQVGLRAAVANAVPQVRESVDFVTERTGGTGAVREVCDLILRAQNRQDEALSRYLKS